MSADEPTWWQADGEVTELDAVDAPADSATKPGPLGRSRKVLTIAAVAGGVALTGGVALAAASGGSTTSAAQPAAGGGGFGGPGGTGGAGGFGGFGGGVGRGGGLASIHGEYVVETSSGSYETQLTQRGTASAVSSTSITVTSADGYAKTYVVPSTVSVTSVKAGDTVSIVATLSAGTATVTALNSGTIPTAGSQGRFPTQGGATPSTTT